jgi:acetolactate synthase-1/2/3 large subunit
MIKLSDYVIRSIADLGVTDVFMVSGGGAMHLDDSLGREPRLSYVCNHHEQACAMGVEGFARIRGDLGVAIVTTGPGGTNTISGVLGQWHDSVPALYISGQVRFDTTVASTGLPLRQLGDQEADIVSIVSPITKYAVMVSDPTTIRYHFEKAVHLARTGRPGPVWLDIPVNVQAAMIDEATLAGYDPREEEPTDAAFDTELVDRQAAEVAELLAKAERPVLLAGSGIRTGHAVGEFLALADKLGIPVLTAWNAPDLMWEDHPLYRGRPSTIGDRAGNFAIQNADLLISIGCRLNIRQVGYEFEAFARHAHRVVVDIDPVELRKPTIHPDTAVHSDAAYFIAALDAAAGPDALPRRQEWLDWCRERQQRYPVVLPEYRERRGAVDPYVLCDTLSEMLDPGEVIVTANGAASVVAFQALRMKPGMRMLANSGTASMGYDVPAAIGACVASGRGRVICLAGDGSMQMNLQELQTIVGNRLPVKIFVFDNDGYLSIRQTQDNLFGGNHVGEGPDSGVTLPDMVRIAGAYGLPAVRVSEHADLEAAIRTTLETPGPALCDVVMPAQQVFAPKVAAERRPDGTIVSKPLEDMTPLLPRDEFASNMLVEPWEPGR